MHIHTQINKHTLFLFLSSLLIFLATNALTAALTQARLVGFCPHSGGACWRVVVVLLLLLFPVAILSDFAKEHEQDFFHLFLGKTWEFIFIFLAIAAALSKGPHDHGAPACIFSQPITEQHNHTCWRPGFVAGRTLESVVVRIMTIIRMVERIWNRASQGLWDAADFSTWPICLNCPSTIAIEKNQHSYLCVGSQVRQVPWSSLSL